MELRTKSLSSPAAPGASARSSPGNWPKRAPTSPLPTVALRIRRRPWRGIRAHGVEGMALPLDVMEWDKPKAVVEQVVQRFGRVDMLVNSASVWQSAPFLEITRQQWETSIGANLTGPFLCAQAVAPYMLEQESGHIVNIIDLSAQPDLGRGSPTTRPARPDSRR